MSQPSLFDAAQGERAKTRALESVAANNEAWIGLAYEYAVRLGPTLHEFTTDAIWQAMYLAGAPRPKEARSMGALIQRLIGEHRIFKTGRTEKSAIAACHRRDKTVWRWRA